MKKRFHLGVWGWWQGNNLGDNWIRHIMSEAFPMAKMIDTTVQNFDKFDMVICGGGGLFLYDVIAPWDNLEKVSSAFGMIGLGAEFPLQSDYAAVLEKKAMFFWVRDYYSVNCMRISNAAKAYDCTFIHPLPWTDLEQVNDKKLFFVWRDGQELLSNDQFHNYIDSVDSAKQCWEMSINKYFDTILEDDFQTNDYDMLSHIRDCGFVISGRYHGIVAAIQRGLPFVAIDICPKIRALLQEADLEEYCIKISEIDRIDECIVSALNNTHAIRKKEWEYRQKAMQTMKQNVEIAKARMTEEFQLKKGFGNIYWRAK